MRRFDSVPALQIKYLDPLADHGPNRSLAWYQIWQDYRAFRVEVRVENLCIPVSHVEPNPKDGGRSAWDTPEFKAEVEHLVTQIRESGTFTAILVRRTGDTYEIIDGHHRFHAWSQIGLDIPAVVVTTTPIQRHGLG